MTIPQLAMIAQQGQRLPEGLLEPKKSMILDKEY
jgi:hypothetical protein